MKFAAIPGIISFHVIKKNKKKNNNKQKKRIHFFLQSWSGVINNNQTLMLSS